MINRIIAAAAVFAASLFVADGALAANLIQNGSFEKPVVPGGGFNTFSTGSKFSGWTVAGVSGNVALVSGTFTTGGITFVAKKGSQWLNLAGTSNSRTWVVQKVPTTLNQNYKLTFSVGNVVNPGSGLGTTSTVAVAYNNKLLIRVTNKNGAGSAVQVWKQFSVTFTATSTHTRFLFINEDPANDSANGLDAVSLIPVP
jgi:Protein of unknown function (DUF642)